MRRYRSSPPPQRRTPPRRRWYAPIAAPARRTSSGAGVQRSPASIERRDRHAVLAGNLTRLETSPVDSRYPCVSALVGLGASKTSPKLLEDGIWLRDLSGSRAWRSCVLEQSTRALGVLLSSAVATTSQTIGTVRVSVLKIATWRQAAFRRAALVEPVGIARILARPRLVRDARRAPGPRSLRGGTRARGEGATRGMAGCCVRSGITKSFCSSPPMRRRYVVKPGPRYRNGPSVAVFLW